MNVAYVSSFRFDVFYAVVLAILDAIGYPADGIFDTSWYVAVSLMGTDRHEHIWKVLDRQTQISSWSFTPFVDQVDIVNTAEVDGFEGSGD